MQPSAGSREERIAYNEDWSRQLNERKAEWLDNGYEWRKVRSRDNRFAVAPGEELA